MLSRRGVDALAAIPEGSAELQRRATAIETLCGPGSEYEGARAAALGGLLMPTKANSASRHIKSLRRIQSPMLFSQVLSVRDQIKTLAEETSTHLRGHFVINDQSLAKLEQWLAATEQCLMQARGQGVQNDGFAVLW